MEDQHLTYLRESLKPFFRDEVLDWQDKQCILNFVQCDHYRIGEYEGNIWVIQKLDRNNFIIYAEDQDRQGTRIEVHHAVAIQRKYLVDLLTEYEV